MSTYRFKSRFQALVRPLANKFVGWGWTPNQVTLFTCLASVLYAGGICWFQGNSWLFFTVPLFLMMRMVFNAVDGLMAMENDLCSPLGIYLNELGDVVSDVSLYLAIGWVARVPIEILGLFILFAFLSEMAGVIAVQIQSPRRYDGPMGKSDRAVLMSVLALLLGFEVQPRFVYEALFALGIGALLLTVFNRVRFGLKHSAIRHGS